MYIPAIRRRHRPTTLSYFFQLLHSFQLGSAFNSHTVVRLCSNCCPLDKVSLTKAGQHLEGTFISVICPFIRTTLALPSLRLKTIQAVSFSHVCITRYEFPSERLGASITVLPVLHRGHISSGRPEVWHTRFTAE